MQSSVIGKAELNTNLVLGAETIDARTTDALYSLANAAIGHLAAMRIVKMRRLDLEIFKIR